VRAEYAGRHDTGESGGDGEQREYDHQTTVHAQSIS
jgi:hypothetical protein